MRKIWNKGHRIRASDKHLVYHFSIGTLLFVFVAVLLLLNIKQLMRADWEHFSLFENGLTLSPYTNPIAVAKNGGWRYGYGNMFYVELVNQYLTVSQVSGELAQKVMNEALKYQGWKYVYGGSNPNTSFDCSGLTQWCYGKAGISLPRTAQAQYDATQHLPLSQAKAGDLVFFHSTYNAGSYVTHVGILVSPTQMYHAGNPIGYADLSSSYWQQHLIGAGRVKQ